MFWGCSSVFMIMRKDILFFQDSSSFTLRLHAIPPPGFFKPSRFHPQRNNIRTEWYTGLQTTQSGEAIFFWNIIQYIYLFIYFVLNAITRLYLNLFCHLCFPCYLQKELDLLPHTTTAVFWGIYYPELTCSFSLLSAPSVQLSQMVWLFSKSGCVNEILQRQETFIDLLTYLKELFFSL